MKSLYLSAALMAVTGTSTAGELLVNWHNSDHAHSAAMISQVAEQTGLTLSLKQPKQASFDLLQVEQSNQIALTKLLDSGYFKMVEERAVVKVPDVRHKPISPVVTAPKSDIGTQALPVNQFNDPLFLQQDYLDDQGDNWLGRSSILTARQYAEANTQLDRKVRVAVLDTGKWLHKDIQWADDEAAFIDNSFYGYCLSADHDNLGNDLVCPSDDVVNSSYGNDAMDKNWSDDGDGNYQVAVHGHGLAVASQIAAIANNGTGMIGIVPHQSLELVPVKVLSSAGSGGNFGIADGIWWAIGMYSNGDLQLGDAGYVEPISAPVDIINLSLGGNSNLTCERYSYFYSAVEEAYKRNVHVVIAAGNEYEDTRYKQPANCDIGFTVASNQESGELSRFSNWGEMVDISVDGEEITTAHINAELYGQTENGDSGYFGCDTEGGWDDCYTTSTGTSMSTPNAAGVLALLKLVHPDKSAQEREAMLRATAVQYHQTPTGQLTQTGKLGYGAGVINAAKAIRFEPLSLTQITVKHHYQGFDSDAQQLLVEQMTQLNSGACEMVDISFGALTQAVDGIVYHVAQTSQTGEWQPTEEDTSLYLQTPEVVIDRSNLDRVAIQSCKQDQCSPWQELDFSELAYPQACSSS